MIPPPVRAINEQDGDVPGVASCGLNASAFQYYAGTTHLVHFAAKPFVDHESFEASQRVRIYRYDPNVPNFETSTLAIEHSSHEFHPAKINGSLSTPFNAYVYSVPITPPLPAGSVIFARLRMYNRAGVSIESDSRPIMLDDTRPQHPSLSSCEEADSIQVGLNHWLQRNQSGISVCWPAPGFETPVCGSSSGRSRSSPTTHASHYDQAAGQVWNSFGPFVAATSDDKLFGPTAVSSLLDDGRYRRSAAELQVGVLQGSRYRFALRAINRAGLQSLDPSLDAFAASQWSVHAGAGGSQQGVTIDIDNAAPTCSGLVRLCDPALTPSTGSTTRCHLHPSTRQWNCQAPNDLAFLGGRWALQNPYQVFTRLDDVRGGSSGCSGASTSLKPACVLLSSRPSF